MTTAAKAAEALLTELEGATWARYREDRLAIITGHFEKAIAGAEIAREPRAERNTEYDPERREIAERVAAYREEDPFEEGIQRSRRGLE